MVRPSASLAGAVVDIEIEHPQAAAPDTGVGGDAQRLGVVHDVRRRLLRCLLPLPFERRLSFLVRVGVGVARHGDGAVAPVPEPLA